MLQQKNQGPASQKSLESSLIAAELAEMMVARMGVFDKHRTDETGLACKHSGRRIEDERMVAAAASVLAELPAVVVSCSNWGQDECAVGQVLRVHFGG